MKIRSVALSIAIVSTLTAAASGAPLKMPPVPELTLAAGTTPSPLAVALRLSPEVRDAVYELRTSPFDKVSFAIGPFTAELLEKNLAKAFTKVGRSDSRTVPEGFDAVLEVTIVEFGAVVPMPAYNPYTATMVYRAEVWARDGEKLFTQTTSGAGQSGKGMLSGFKARSLAAEAAAAAMTDAARQLLEGLATAPELEISAPPAPASTSGQAPPEAPPAAPQPSPEPPPPAT